MGPISRRQRRRRRTSPASSRVDSPNFGQIIPEVRSLARGISSLFDLNNGRALKCDPSERSVSQCCSKYFSSLARIAARIKPKCLDDWLTDWTSSSTRFAFYGLLYRYLSSSRGFIWLQMEIDLLTQYVLFPRSMDIKKPVSGWLWPDETRDKENDTSSLIFLPLFILSDARPRWWHRDKTRQKWYSHFVCLLSLFSSPIIASILPRKKKLLLLLLLFFRRVPVLTVVPSIPNHSKHGWS